MKSMTRLLLLFGLMTLLFGSCTINKNLLFKTDRDYQYDPIPDFDSLNTEYRIGPNDFITVSVFSNDGGIVFENTTTSVERARPVNPIDLNYLVDVRGYVDLPIVGVQKVAGLTLIEAQQLLAELYSIQFHDPYVIVRIVNRRIIVFPGSGGEAKVLPLMNPNVSVVEALALATGVAKRGNSSRVKLIRKVGDKQEVYRIDLSRIEGVKYANMPVEAGDIIYVEPVPNLAPEILQDIQPIITLITSISFFYFLFTR